MLLRCHRRAHPAADGRHCSTFNEVRPCNATAALRCRRRVVAIQRRVLVPVRPISSCGLWRPRVYDAIIDTFLNGELHRVDPRHSSAIRIIDAALNSSGWCNIVANRSSDGLCGATTAHHLEPDCNPRLDAVRNRHSSVSIADFHAGPVALAQCGSVHPRL